MEQRILNPVKQVYKADEVANCFIAIADEQVFTDQDGKAIKEGITNLKLQKMLYFAQAAHLALFGKELFGDEIQAWDLGPVVQSVYARFSGYGDKPIHLDETITCSHSELRGFLQDVWKIFGKYSASELVYLSHNHAPWKKYYKPGIKNIIIPKEEIELYYKSLFKLESDEKAK